MFKHSSLTLAVVVLLAACRSEEKQPASDSPAPAPSASSSAPADSPISAAPSKTTDSPAPGAGKEAAAPAGPGQVDLSFEGALTARLAGSAGRCSVMSGAVEGASFQVRSSELGVAPDFELTILVTSEEEWASPSIVLNVKGPERASYARNTMKPRAEDKIALARDVTSAEIDVELKQVAGAGAVKIVGSIRCPKQP